MGGDATRFYLDSVFPHVQTFNHPVELIGQEYNSSVQLNRVNNVLNTPPLRKLCENQDEGEELSKVYKIITNLAPKVPRSHRWNAPKIEFLRNAVVGFDWATEPLSRIATQNLSFQQLYGELEVAHQLDKEAKLAVLGEKVGSARSTRDNDESNIACILYQGQRRYAFRNKAGNKFFDSSQKKNKFDPLTIMGCFNCGDPSHMLQDCMKDVGLVNAAKRRLEYMEKCTGKKRNAHAVLFALCYQQSEKHDDEAGSSLKDEDGNITDQELFATVMNQMNEGASEGENNEGNAVHLVEADFSVYTIKNDKNLFLGACLDTGASVSLIRRQKAEKYSKKAINPLLIEITPKKTFRFGSQTKQSIGKLGSWYRTVMNVPCR